MLRIGLALGSACLLAAACTVQPAPTPPPSASPTTALSPTATASGSRPPATDPASPTPLPSPTPPASPTPPGPSGLEWTAVALPVDEAYSTIGVIGVAALDRLYLVVGVGWQEDDKGVQVNAPLFWLSGDGLAWELAADAEWPGGDIDAVTSWQGRFLAAGHVGDERAVAAFWTSADGRAWQRLPDRPVLEFFRGATEGRDIVAGGIAGLRVEADELVAIGWLYCACEREIREGAIEWRTANGEQWTRTDGPASEGWQEPIPGGSGWLRISADGSAVEASTDAVDWQPAWAPPAQAGPTAQLFALDAVPGGFLAVGVLIEDGAGSPLAVSSSDGLAWTPSAGWPAIDGLDGTIVGFAATQAAIVGAGQVGDPAQPYVWLHRPVIAGS